MQFPILVSIFFSQKRLTADATVTDADYTLFHVHVTSTRYINLGSNSFELFLLATVSATASFLQMIKTINYVDALFGIWSPRCRDHMSLNNSQFRKLMKPTTLKRIIRDTGIKKIQIFCGHWSLQSQIINHSIAGRRIFKCIQMTIFLLFFSWIFDINELIFLIVRWYWIKRKKKKKKNMKNG